MTTLLVPFQGNRNPVPEKAGDCSHNIHHLLHGLIVYWVDPLGHSLNKVFIPLIKTRGILLFRIERMLFDREILPSPIFKNRPSELDQTCVGFRFRPGRKKTSQNQFSDLHRKHGLPGLKRMALASVEGDMADDAAMGFCHTKERSRCDRIGRNADGIGIEGKSPCPGLRQDVEEGGTETVVMLP